MVVKTPESDTLALLPVVSIKIFLWPFSTLSNIVTLEPPQKKITPAILKESWPKKHIAVQILMYKSEMRSSGRMHGDFNLIPVFPFYLRIIKCSELVDLIADHHRDDNQLFKWMEHSYFQDIYTFMSGNDSTLLATPIKVPVLFRGNNR